MVAQSWTKPLVKTALLMLAGAALCCAQPPKISANGQLDGRLTDTRSAPLDNMTVILRSAVTGVEHRATTTRGGHCHFNGLPQGEYSLTAVGPQGDGHVDGIFVPAGHETRVQIAIALEHAASSPPLAVSSAPASVTAQPPVAATLPVSAEHAATKTTAPPDLSIQNAIARAHPAPAREAVLTIPIPAALNDPTLAVKQGAIEASLLGPAAKPAAQLAAIQAEAQPSQALDATQLQVLPASGRNWQAFARDAASQPDESGEQRGPSAATAIATQLKVDDASPWSSFGGAPVGRSRSRASALPDPASGESALRMVQPANSAATLSPEVDPAATFTNARHGTGHFHGQAFVFNRQNLFGARNPFTQWVQETSPSTPATIPVFTPEPWSPGDKEIRWGAGIGSVIRARRLFWFAALDGYERNDPGVATVKHPDNFFAQPSNDQMQLLSAQLGLNSADPVSAGLGAYSKLLENLSGLLGSTSRSSSQWTGFGRIDASIGERHHLTLEATGARLQSPGGGFTRASETYGTHSFGDIRATQQWILGRWEAFITPNLLAVTQGSYGHQVQSALPEPPSAFEQSFNINAWGRLPQIVVDSRYGFTIGNPARFGPGSYPDEQLLMAQEQLNWVRGNLMMKAGVEANHNRDATSRLRNQTGTYYYSSIENLASDALAFSTFGLSAQLNPLNQHNCDQTGRAWRDSNGVLHGLGYIPCYSWYSQTMGPADWWLSTNDWASYLTSQWQPTRQSAFTLAMRWELEQLPPAISNLTNLDLPLTAHMPSLGSQWGPRAGFAWGAAESRWPVVRLGYGVYFSRTRNSVIENALTQTGSPKGDLNFFMRPTDNLNSGGAPPFPYVLAGDPANIVKPGAVEFAPSFRNGQVQQAEASIEETLPARIHLEAAGIASLGRRLPITTDANIDSAQSTKTITYAVTDANSSGPIKSPTITVPFFASWPSVTSPTGFAGRLNPNYQQVSEISSRANSTYEAAFLRLSRTSRAFTVRARYTYAHAMDWNPDETSQVTAPSVLDPIDFRQEFGTSALDVRHSASAALIVQSPWKLKNLAGHVANGWTLSGTAYFRSGLPYTMRTAGSLAKEFDASGNAIVALSSGMNGYGGDNRVYGVGRNTFRYPATWKADLRMGKRFNLGSMRQLELMAESFNLFNHQNVTELETTGYSIEPGTVTGGLPRLNFLTGLKTGQTAFGRPLNINATDFYRERQLQFGARLRF